MSKIFVFLYNWFSHHKKTFYAILLMCVAVLTVMASRISFQENITNFFNSSDENKNEIFEKVQAKDKIIVMISGEDPDEIIASAEIFETSVDSMIEAGLITSITGYADAEVVGKCSSFIYNYLPIFLTEADYEELESKNDEEGVSSAIESVYSILTSPSGMFIGGVVVQDPLGIGTHLLQKFEQFNPSLQYEIYNDRLFTKDLTTMLMFINPCNGMGDTGRNDELVSKLEEAERNAEINGVSIDCLGGPIVAVYNARQIKKDTTLTLGLAILFILFVIFLSFRNKWSIPLIVVPPAFGALFALAMVWLIQGEISAIAIGAGAVVLGISLSYSIHIVAHLNHSSSPVEIIEELTLPLTIGCFTTIGAFAVLMFTSSSLLKDMGLFSVMALIGTTIFCLVFLPQFLKAFDASKSSKLLTAIERGVGYRFDHNKWVVLPIILTTIVALFYYRDVEFDDDMSNINYMPEHIVEAEKRSLDFFGNESKDVYLVTGGSDFDYLANEYLKLESSLLEYKDSGELLNVVTVKDFIIPFDVQVERIERWNKFWAQNRDNVLALVETHAQKCGFKKNAFAGFEQIVKRDYSICDYSKEVISDVPAISEWVNTSHTGSTILSKITINKENKEKVYQELESLEHTAVVDRAYFSSKMVESTSDDFNYILWVSSMIVFIALFVSYGRIELTLLSFLPMAISWVVILGLMAVLNIKFNIVNIILATFIFGIGDDFSIFIMDGLLHEYKNGKKVLGAHKTAIFFSAFTAIVGMGVLIFAQHPALKSIALISVLGLSVVVLVSYTVQPLLFRLLISSHTEKGRFPYTFFSILNTVYCFLYFLLGCIFSQLYMLVLMVLPLKRSTKKLAFHKMIYWFARIFLKSMIIEKVIHVNDVNETYKCPAVIIANHQSFIDILLLLSTTPKIVMVTNSWVWNSPFFGWIVRYADFHHSADGYEALAENIKERINEGYSVIVFPEGTRSEDCSIRRFHKGAFYLADLLKLDILPVLLYGTGQVSSKKQGFYIHPGVVVCKTMCRLKYGDVSMGTTYQERTKKFRRWYEEQYCKLHQEFGHTDNAYFREALIKNYIYKGPVLEWYMRVKCRIDGYYNLWDKLIPRNAVVTDMGCGHGQLSFMIGLLSPNRKVLGVDYDLDKVDTAQHSFLTKRCNVNFECADMCTYVIPQSDAILFNDSLHYVNPESQYQILSNAVLSLKPNGMIIVRDGDASQTEKHGKIKQTEVWSTKIIKFNKTTQQLSFVNAEWMRQFADEHHLSIKIRSCDENSSETLYILTPNCN